MHLPWGGSARRALSEGFSIWGAFLLERTLNRTEFPADSSSRWRCANSALINAPGSTLSSGRAKRGRSLSSAARYPAEFRDAFP